MIWTVFIFGWVALAGTAGAEEQILDLLKNQSEAWNRGDLEGFMEGYWNSDDLTFYSSDGITSGWQATLNRYRLRYRGEGKSMGRLTFSNLLVESLSDDSAFVRGRWQLAMPDGALPGGHFTLVLRKTPDGWRIIHDHTT